MGRRHPQTAIKPSLIWHHSAAAQAVVAVVMLAVVLEVV
jgi:hypothetical protein